MAEQQTLSLEECFQIADETPGQIDMTNIFPNAGHYFVEVDELIPGINRADPDHLKPYVRVPLSILRVEGQEKSGLVGRSFSIFLSLDKVKSAKADRPPISFTARAMYRLRNGKFPDEPTVNTQTLHEWIGELPGTKFIVSRVTYHDAKNVLRSRDTLISVEEWKEKAKLDGTPEADPEAVAAEMTL